MDSHGPLAGEAQKAYPFVLRNIIGGFKQLIARPIRNIKQKCFQMHDVYELNRQFCIRIDYVLNGTLNSRPTRYTSPGSPCLVCH